MRTPLPTHPVWDSPNAALSPPRRNGCRLLPLPPFLVATIPSLPSNPPSNGSLPHSFPLLLPATHLPPSIDTQPRLFLPPPPPRQTICLHCAPPPPSLSSFPTVWIEPKSCLPPPPSPSPVAFLFFFVLPTFVRSLLSLLVSDVVFLIGPLLPSSVSRHFPPTPPPRLRQHLSEILPTPVDNSVCVELRARRRFCLLARLVGGECTSAGDESRRLARCTITRGALPAQPPSESEAGP